MTQKRGKVIMRQKRIILLALGVLSLVLLAAVLFFFRYRPLVAGEEQLSVLSLSVTVGENGKSQNYDISNQEEIPQELNNALAELFRGVKIRNTLLPPGGIYGVSDGSVYITIKVGADSSRESGSFRVNLCTDSSYNSVQFGDTHYRIAGGQALFEQVYALVQEAILLPAEE